MYLQYARDAYLRWSANALVERLEWKCRALLSRPEVESSGSMLHTLAGSAVTDSRTTSAVSLDMATTVRAAQALARELDPAHVVACLMDLVRENAGAENAALVTLEGEELTVSALITSNEFASLTWRVHCSRGRR